MNTPTRQYQESAQSFHRRLECWERARYICSECLLRYSNFDAAARCHRGGVINRDLNVIIKRDGEIITIVSNTEETILRWFHKHTPNSMDWAIKYDGYSVER